MIRKLIYSSLFFLVGVLTSMWLHEKEIPGTLRLTPAKVDVHSPPCLRMYYAIEKYAEKYNIPKNYAYGIAYKETRYCGPFHWTYDQRQGSSAGALGPMQVMHQTAKGMWKDTSVAITHEMIRNDIDFNVETSMKLCRVLYDKYKDWKTVFGCYNTGQVLVNQYAIDVYNFDPIAHWK